MTGVPNQRLRTWAASASALSLALTLAACSADEGSPGPPSTTTAGAAAPSVATDEELTLEDAPPSELTRSTVTAESVLTGGSVGAVSTLERRAIELFTEFDAEQRGESAVIDLPDNVLFDFGLADLKPEADGVLADLIELAGLTEDAPIAIIGHTDGIGSDELNKDLSERRAKAVADALVAAGVDAGRITSEGVGASQPVAEEGGPDDEAARAKNRRVEVSFGGIDIQQ